MSCCPLVVQYPVGNRGSFLAGRLLLHDQYELHSQITEPVRLFFIRVKTMLCFFYPQFPTSLYYFPLHLLLRLLCFPHSPPPSLHHLLLLLLFVTSSFVSSCDSTHLCPPPLPPAASQLLRLALIVSQFQRQERRIYTNQRWQNIAELSSGPIHGGQVVAEPESVQLPLIT